MPTHMRYVLAIGAAMMIWALAGCSATVSPGGGVPQVAGTYTGPLMVTVVDTGTRVVGAMRLIVEQAGSELTISGSITLEGTTTNLTAASGTINKTGHFMATRSGVVDPDALNTALCGSVRPVSGSSLTFSGREALFSAAVQTDRCGPISYDATLTR